MKNKMKKLVVILFVLIAGMQLQAQVNPSSMSATAKAQFQAALDIKDSTWIDAYIKSLPGYVETSATAAELNILDGALASTTEVNYLVGVTSNIQTQLNAKVANTDLDTIQGGVYSKPEVDSLRKIVELQSYTSNTTLSLSDAGKTIQASNATSLTITVPPNSSVAFPTGTFINVIATGAGDVDIAAGAGVTINSESSMLTIGAQYASVSLVKVGTDTWILIGRLKA